MSSNTSVRWPEFGHGKPVIGVVHLLPLPGSPFFRGSLDEVFHRALSDATALARGGVDGIIVENLGDAPFTRGRVKPHVVAFMTAVIERIRLDLSLPIGVNVLRNDALSAMGIAAATGASFIRVNVLTGAMVTDQGIIQGESYELLRYRDAIRANDVAIFADIMVKHAYPLGNQYDPIQSARDTFGRGGADALIITGSETGSSADPTLLAKLKKAVPEARILVGSGINPENIASFSEADGFIVGTALKFDGKVENPVDVDRVKELVRAADRFRN